MNDSTKQSTSEDKAPKLTRKGEATKARIVSAASELIFERGVAETSVEDVQKKAGVSASQLYHYFADKQSLVHAVIDFQTEAVLSNQQPFLGHLDSFEAFEKWRNLLVETQRQLQCRGGCPLGSLSTQLSEIDPQARLSLANSFGAWEAPIRSGIAAMRAKGILSAAADPERLALAMLTALQGGLLLSQTYRDTAPLEVALDVMIEHLRTYAV